MKSTESRIDLILGLPEPKKKSGYNHIKFFFPSGEAKSGAPLSPIVSMFQLNITQVCKDLNDTSSKYYISGVRLPAKIFKLKAAGKTAIYRLQLGSPTIQYYIRMILLSTIDFKRYGITDEMRTSSVNDSTRVESKTDVKNVSVKKKSKKASSGKKGGANKSSSPNLDELVIPFPNTISICSLYDIAKIHGYNKGITIKRSAFCVFGTLSSISVIKNIQFS
jgi:hypothetical protein